MNRHNFNLCSECICQSNDSNHLWPLCLGRYIFRTSHLTENPWYFLRGDGNQIVETSQKLSAISDHVTKQPLIVSRIAKKHFSPISNCSNFFLGKVMYSDFLGNFLFLIRSFPISFVSGAHLRKWYPPPLLTYNSIFLLTLQVRVVVGPLLR